MSMNPKSALTKCRKAPDDVRNHDGVLLEASRVANSVQIIIQDLIPMMANTNTSRRQGSPDSTPLGPQGCEASNSSNLDRVRKALEMRARALGEHCEDLNKLIPILEQPSRKKEARWVVTVKPEALAGPIPRTAMPSTYIIDCTVRVNGVEAFRHQLYLLCFSDRISDVINQEFSDFRYPELKDLYEALSNDKFVIAGHYLDTNYALRWLLMGGLYILFDKFVFRSSTYNQASAHEATTYILFKFLLPFLSQKKGFKKLLYLDEKSKFNDIRKQLSALVDGATQLRRLLDSDGTAEYTMTKLRLVGSNRRTASLGNSVTVVHVLGAEHGDDSRDLTWLMVFGQLTKRLHSRLDHRVVHETKPWVVVYRPEKKRRAPGKVESQEGH